MNSTSTTATTTFKSSGQKFPVLKVKWREGKQEKKERSRRCSWRQQQSFWWPGARWQVQGHNCSVPKETAVGLNSGEKPLTTWLQSGSRVCFDGEKTVEQKRDQDLPSTLLQHLVVFFPLLFLSGKGFKMQLNKKNILEQVSRQSFLSFCLMKAMSSQ